MPDTSAWVHYLRDTEESIADAVQAVIEAGSAVACGPVLFELLKGCRSEKQERSLLGVMSGLDFIEMGAETWVAMGRLSAGLRAKGEAMPPMDLAIAAIALQHDLTVLTVDRHFRSVPGLKVSYGG